MKQVRIRLPAGATFPRSVRAVVNGFEMATFSFDASLHTIMNCIESPVSHQPATDGGLVCDDDYSISVPGQFGDCLKAAGDRLPSIRAQDMTWRVKIDDPIPVKDDPSGRFFVCNKATSHGACGGWRRLKSATVLRSRLARLSRSRRFSLSFGSGERTSTSSKKRAKGFCRVHRWIRISW